MACLIGRNATLKSIFQEAGKFAAHAIWCVSDGSTLVPIFVASQGSDCTMHRIAAAALEQAVSIGQNWLENGKMSEKEAQLSAAALLYEIKLTIGSEKMDAIAINIRDYSNPLARAMLCIPFTPQKGPMGLFGKFKVHRPKMTEWTNCEQFKTDEVLEEFWKGVDSHEQGSRVWSNAMDQSR